jgi:hypothetical protein
MRGAPTSFRRDFLIMLRSNKACSFMVRSMFADPHTLRRRAACAYEMRPRLDIDPGIRYGLQLNAAVQVLGPPTH